MKTIKEMLKDCKCSACIWSDILDDTDWDGEIICRARVPRFPDARDYTHDHDDWCQQGQWLCQVSSTTPSGEGVVCSDVLNADKIVWSYTIYNGPREITIIPKHTEPA